MLEFKFSTAAGIKTVIFAGSLISLAVSTQAVPGAGGEFEIISHSIDGGGGRSTDAEFELVGIVGQHDAGTITLSYGEFSLSGGFWAEPGDSDVIFSSGFEPVLGEMK